jgi:hypothetical protein
VIALTLTVVVLQVLRAPHAPAGATTLIVGLGILDSPRQLAVLLAAAVLVTVLASAANLAAGVRQVGVTDRGRGERQGSRR